jgi:hypothetical protein
MAILVPKRPRGRPRLPTTRSRFLAIRHTDEQHADLQRRADEAGLSLVDYARRVLWPE